MPGKDRPSGSEVAFADDLHVMELVAGDDVTQRAHADLAAGGNPAALPILGVEGAEHVEIALAYAFELVDEAGPVTLIEAAHGDVWVLIEACEGRCAAAAETQRAVGED